MRLRAIAALLDMMHTCTIKLTDLDSGLEPSGPPVRARSTERRRKAMQRNYYHINEENARIAHDMMSFSDYQQGGTTAAYRAEVDEAYTIADRAAEMRQDSADKIYALADRYSSRAIARIIKQLQGKTA